MKIALLLCGNIRTWEQTKESFDKFFKDVNYDLFVSTYDKLYEYHPYWANQHPELKEIVLDEEYIKNLFINKSKNIIITKSFENDLFIEQERKKMNIQMKDYFHGFSQYNNIKKGLELVEKYENEGNFKYDFIIKTRFDLLYNDTLKFNLNNDTIFIDSKNVFPNDWFFIIERKNVNKFIDFMINEYYQYNYISSKEKPPHGVFENSCKHNNLKISTNNYVLKVLRKF